MGLLDLLLGTGTSNNATKKPRSSFSSSMDEYDEYYEDTYNDAMSGDEDAIAEMRSEFGDDWDGEY